VIKPVCRLRNVLKEAMTAYLDTLDHYSLEDLLVPRNHLTDLLEIQRETAPAA
jgi:Rrf2 family nitric oxide-sensitive transcriptional repressor